MRQWRNCAPLKLELPTDYPRPQTQGLRGVKYAMVLSAELLTERSSTSRWNYRRLLSREATSKYNTICFARRYDRPDGRGLLRTVGGADGRARC